MKDILNDIKTSVEHFAKIIDAPNHLLPTYGNSKDSHPNIEVNENGELSYEVYERGEVVKLEYALNTDHLLYLVFQNITFTMASKYASEHDDDTIDFRRILFEKQLELLGKLNKDWKERQKMAQDNIVLSAPFNDYVGKRQAYVRELMGNGFLYEEAVEKANEKYP